MHWNPAFPLSRILVKDSAAPKPAQQFGSFFVMRKLEQTCAPSTRPRRPSPTRSA